MSQAFPKVALALLATLAAGFPACAKPGAPVAAGPKVCLECVRSDMQTLAGEAMQGRRCGTPDEARAAAYVETRLKGAGVRPAFANGSFHQTVRLTTPQLGSPPVLRVAALSFTHGDQMAVLNQPVSFSGPLLRIGAAGFDPARVKGAVVLDERGGEARSRPALFAAGAVAVLRPGRAVEVKHWDQMADNWRTTEVVDAPSSPDPDAAGTIIALKPEAIAALQGAKDGETVTLRVQPAQPEQRTTQNVVGVVHGSAPDADSRAILLSAHYDHLGLHDGVLYPGADDDASGTAAVLEFARLIGKSPRPRRTVYFALFGCEEEGGLGATYFRAHPPTKLTDLAANLEFEMIGLRDPRHKDVLMLTGWERSNLGPTLASHGARLGPDPYPEEHFFQRSDNYQLALKGVVAQTVGGWPNPPTYHQPTDDLAHVDVGFMGEVIQSMVAPVLWLIDSDFTPEWNPGQKP